MPRTTHKHKATGQKVRAEACPPSGKLPDNVVPWPRGEDPGDGSIGFIEYDLDCKRMPVCPGDMVLRTEGNGLMMPLARSKFNANYKRERTISDA